MRVVLRANLRAARLQIQNAELIRLRGRVVPLPEGEDGGFVLPVLHDHVAERAGVPLEHLLLLPLHLHLALFIQTPKK